MSDQDFHKLYPEEFDEAHTVIAATRQMANDANARLRTQLLTALGRTDDSHTSLSGYISHLVAQRDALKTALAKADEGTAPVPGSSPRAPEPDDRDPELAADVHEGWMESKRRLEKVYEAFAETDPKALREELIRVAAVAVAWAEAIDRRTSGPAGESPPAAAAPR